MTAISISARRLLVAAVATGIAAALLAVSAPLAIAAGRAASNGTWRTAGFEELLVGCCALVATGATGWWWLGTLRLVSAIAAPVADPARLPRRTGLPQWWRRAVLTGCGVALATGPAAPALAATSLADPGAPDEASSPATHGLPAATGDRPAAGPGGLPLPDRVVGGRSRPSGPQGDRTPVSQRPAAHASAPSPSHAGAAMPAPAMIRVEPGDSLWAIAGAELATQQPGSAGPVAVTERWHQIYRANLERIGTDPDLIQPGQRLRLPPPSAPHD